MLQSNNKNSQSYYTPLESIFCASSLELSTPFSSTWRMIHLDEQIVHDEQGENEVQVVDPPPKKRGRTPSPIWSSLSDVKILYSLFLKYDFSISCMYCRVIAHG
jgi:hypothetical protein